ncbi:heat shock protein 30 [Ctenopharyngodon idella]|nr:heat shock protein 30 [Ctenopharyngodon idella]
MNLLVLKITRYKAERLAALESNLNASRVDDTRETREHKTLNMLSLHGFQPSFSSLMGTEWPVRSLWPEITALHRHAEVLQEARSSLEKLQHEIFEEMQQEEIYPVSCAVEKDGSRFALTLDTRDFSPEELSVRQVGRKLQVCGKTQKKQEDPGKGSYSCRIQEFRRVFDLPEGVNPEGLSCSMADDGKLYIQAPVNQRSEDAERKISTDCEAVKTVETQHEATTDQKTE